MVPGKGGVVKGEFVSFFFSYFIKFKNYKIKEK